MTFYGVAHLQLFVNLSILQLFFFIFSFQRHSCALCQLALHPVSETDFIAYPHFYELMFFVLGFNDAS